MSYSRVCTICAMTGQDLVDISYERDKEMCNRFEFLLQIKFHWEDSSFSKKFCTVCIHLLRSFSLYFNWCHNVQKMWTERGIDGDVGEAGHFSKSEECLWVETNKWELQSDFLSTSGEDRTPQIDVLVSTLPDSIKKEIIKEEIVNTQITENLVESNNSELSVELVKTEFPLETVVSKLLNRGSELPLQGEFEPDGNRSNNDNVGDKVSVDETVSCVSNNRLNNETVENVFPKVVCTGERKRKRKLEKKSHRSKKKKLDADNRKRRRTVRMILPKSVSGKGLLSGVVDNTPQIRVPEMDILISILLESVKRKILKEETTDFQITESLVDGNNFSKSGECLRVESNKWELENDLPSMLGEGRTPKIDVLVSTLPDSVKKEILKEEITDSQSTENLVDSNNFTKYEECFWDERNKWDFLSTPGEDRASKIDVLISTLPDSIKKEIIKDETMYSQRTGNLVDSNSFLKSEKCLLAESNKWDLPSQSGEDRTPKIEVLVSTLPDSIKKEIIKEEITDTQITENVVDSNNFFKSEECFRVESNKRELENDLLSMLGEDRKPQIKVLVSTLPDIIKKEIIKDETTDSHITEDVVDDNNFSKSEECLRIESYKWDSPPMSGVDRTPHIEVLVSTLPDSIKKEIIKEEIMDTQITENMVDGNNFSKSEECLQVERDKWELENYLLSTLGEDRKPKIEVLISTLSDSIKKEIIKEETTDTQITGNLVVSNNSEHPLEVAKTEFPFKTIVCKLLNQDSEFLLQCEIEPSGNSAHNNNVADKVSFGETASCVPNNRLKNEKVKNVWKRRKTPRRILPKIVSARDPLSAAVGDNTPKQITVPKIYVLVPSLPDSMKKEIIKEETTDTQITGNLVFESNNSELSLEVAKTEFTFETAVCGLLNPDSKFLLRGEFEPDGNSSNNNDNVADKVPLGETASRVSNNRRTNEKVKNVLPRVVCSGGTKRKRKLRKNTYRSKQNKLEEDNRKRRKTPRMILPKSVLPTDSLSAAVGDNTQQQIVVPKIDVPVLTLPSAAKTEFPLETVVNPGSELPLQGEFEPNGNSSNNNNVADKVSLDETASCISNNRLNNEKVKNVFPKVVCSGGTKRKRKLGKNILRSKKEKLEEDNKKRRKTPRMILPKSVLLTDSLSSAVGGNTPQKVVVPKIDVPVPMLPSAVKTEFPFDTVVSRLDNQVSELPLQGECEAGGNGLNNNNNVADKASVDETVSCVSNNRLNKGAVENVFVKDACCGETERKMITCRSKNKNIEEYRRRMILTKSVSDIEDMKPGFASPVNSAALPPPPAGETIPAGATYVAHFKPSHLGSSYNSGAVKRKGKTGKHFSVTKEAACDNFTVNVIDLNIVKKLTEEIVTSVKLELNTCKQLFPKGLNSSKKSFLPVLKRELKHLLEADYMNM